MDTKAVSLYDLLTRVKNALKGTLPFTWWTIAEIAEIKVNFSGHCYMELVEKDDATDTIKARARATIWFSAYRMLKPYFETTTGMELSAGMKIMIRVSAEFHELYGFSLNITDIEPSFTIGEMARQKQEIINRLKAEGVFDMNRSLTLPDIPSKIAIISSKTAAGLGDFIDQLTNNAFGYKFYIKLYPAAMQGDQAEQSIIEALERIYKYENFFDVVVIIRGGGSQADLSCFNSYWLNFNIAQFPVPVLTGIGHEQDETIADLVAWKRLKTPTAVAEFLIDCFRQTEENINEKTMNLVSLVSERVQEENERLTRALMILKPVVKERIVAYSAGLRLKGLALKSSANRLIIKEAGNLTAKRVHLQTAVKEFIGNQKHRIEMREEKNNHLDPFRILKRGYSITYHNGKAVKNPSAVKADEIIETRLAEGTIKSKTLNN